MLSVTKSATQKLYEIENIQNNLILLTESSDIIVLNKNHLDTIDGVTSIGSPAFINLNFEN